jgi:hypothetical protein
MGSTSKSEEEHLRQLELTELLLKIRGLQIVSIAREVLGPLGKREVERWDGTTLPVRTFIY